MLIGTVGRLGAHGQLETGRHTACRTHYPVPAVALVELRTLAGAILGAIAVEDDDGLTDGAGTVGTQFANGQHRGKFGARIGPAVDQITATRRLVLTIVFIP